MTDATKYRCQCCGYLTLSTSDPNSYEICPVCFWEADAAQAADPSSDVGANSVSLEAARINYAKYKASSRQALEHVREPTPNEIPAN